MPRLSECRFCQRAYDASRGTLLCIFRPLVEWTTRSYGRDVFEYRVVRRVTKVGQTHEFAIEKALNTYAAEGWEYTNLHRWELAGIETFVIVFRRQRSVSLETQQQPEDSSDSFNHEFGRPIPPSRR